MDQLNLRTIYSHVIGLLTLLIPIVGLQQHVIAQCNLGASEVQITLPFVGTNQTTCGAGDSLTSSNTVSCGSSSYLDSEDLVYVFTAPTTDLYHFTLTNASEPWAGMKLYDGCPRIGQGGTCIESLLNGSTDKIMSVNLTSGTTYQLVIDRSGTACFTFDLEIDVAKPCPSVGSNGWSNINLPFSDTSLTTCGAGDDLRYYNTEGCGSSSYLDSEDLVYIFTAPTTDLYQFTLTNASEQWAGMKLYDGCPLLDQGGTCIESLLNGSTDKIMSVNLTSGTTYQLVIDRSGTACFTFDLEIDVAKPCPSVGSNGWSNINLPFSDTSLTTCGAGDDLRYYNTESCGSSSYFDSEDLVYIFTAPTTDLYHFTLTNASEQWAGMKLYDGCPLLDQGGTCIEYLLNGSTDKIMSVNLTSGTTYQLVIDRSGTACFTFNLEIDVAKPCPTVGTNGWSNITIPFSDTSLTTCGAGDDLRYYNTEGCGSSSYLDSEDLVYRFTAPTTDLYQFTLTNASEQWAGMKLYDGCPLLDQGGTCIEYLLNGSTDKIMSVNLTSGTTYQLVIDRSGTACFTFDLEIDVAKPCPTVGTNGWSNITIPFSDTSLTTCGAGDDLRYYNTEGCGSSSYFAGEDVVYVFTAPTTDIYHFTLTNANINWAGMKLYDGCPLLDQGGTCIKSLTGITDNGILSANLVSGQTYQLVIDRFNTGCFTFDLTIDVKEECPVIPTTGWTFISSIPYQSSNETTCGMGNDLRNYNSEPCGSSSYFSGEDHVYVFSVTTTELYNIALLNATEPNTGLKLYDDCPLLDGGGSCAGSLTNATSDKILSVNLQAGTTYFLVVDNFSNVCFNYDLSISVPINCPSSDTTGWTYLTSFPVYLNSETNCGNGNQITATNIISCGTSAYLNGEDQTYVFTPTFTDSFYVGASAISGSGTGIKIFEGCPFIGTGGSCIAQIGTGSLDQQLRVWLQSGQSYFIIVDGFAAGCFDFEFSIDTVSSCPITPPVIPNPGPLCPGSVIPTLQVSNPMGTVNWYADASLDSLLSTGQNYTPSSLENLTLYVTNTTYCESEATPVTLQVLSPPAITMLDKQGVDLSERSVSYVSRIESVSSSTQNPDFSPNKLRGEPDVYPQYGAIPGSWTPDTGSGSRAYLELRFSNPSPASAIAFYEVFNPGGIDTIYGLNPQTGRYEILWTSIASPAPAQSRIFQANFDLTSYPLEYVRIAINTSALSGPYHVDAVALMNPRNLMCKGDTVTLSVPYVGTYNWSTGETTQSIQVNPTDTASYTVSVTTPYCTFNSSITVNVLDQITPLAVTNMLPADSAINVATTTSFSWQPSQGATDYDIYLWHDTASQPSTPSRSAIVGIQTYFTGALAPGQKYKWQVVANNHTCNSTPGPIQTFTTLPLPDLVVTSFQADTVGFTGQPLAISFTVKNQGTGTTGSKGWQDAIFLSLDTIFDLEDDFIIGSYPNPKFLLPGESYTQNLEVDIPRNIFGGFYLFIGANYKCHITYMHIPPYTVNNFYCSNPLEEVTLENNLLVSNSTINFQLPILPDLEVITFAPPATSFAGDSITYSYTVENTGDDEAASTVAQLVRDMCKWIPPPMPGYIPEPRIYCGLYEPVWYDQVYWSRDSIFDRFLDTLLYEEKIGFRKERFEAAGNVVPGYFEPIRLPEREQRFNDWYDTPEYLGINETYSRQRKIPLPECAAGTYYLHFVTDGTDFAWESEEEINNVSTRAIQILPTPPPDLVIDSILVSPPIKSSTLAKVEYQIENIGASEPAYDYWYNYFYLSPTPTLDTSTATYLKRSISKNGKQIAAGTSKWYQTHVYIPEGTDGPYHLIVVADAREDVCEFDETNNANSVPITVILTPPPDLEVTRLDLSSPVRVGGSLTIDYTVSNTGPGDAEETWLDSIFISDGATLDSTAIFLGWYEYEDSLKSGEIYDNDGDVFIPLIDTGQYYLYIMTDAGDAVYEHNNEQNNLYRHGPFPVLSRLYSDLEVTSFTASDTGSSGKQISFSYAARNSGQELTYASEWLDRFYVSQDSMITMDTMYVHRQSYLQPLDVNDQYTKSGMLTLPNGLSGDWYLHLILDADNLIANDTSRGNNVFTIPIHIKLSPSPDLAITSITLPSELYTGVRTPIPYTVTNQGSVSAGSIWYDKVALSRYADLNRIHTTVDFEEQMLVLPPGQSYHDTLWAVAHNHMVGNYYLHVKVDHDDIIYEHQAEANNVASRAIEVIQSPPADLEIININVPDTATPGKHSELTYILTNVGVNPAFSSIYNSASVTGDPLPMGMDQSLWGFDRLRDYELQPGMSDTLKIRNEVPAMREGFFRSEMTANVTQSLSELDYTNNTTLSQDSTLSVIPVLPLGQTVLDTLAKQGTNYYRLNLPADEDLRITVQSSAQSGNNAIFLRHLDVPDGPNYHQRNSEGDISDPVLLIPGTSPGANYVTIKNNDVSQLYPTQNISIRADLLPFGIDSIKPNVMGQGRVTSFINGAGFRQGAVVELVDNGNQVMATGNILEFVHSMELKVRWHLDQVPIGIYDLRITNPGGSQATLVNGVTVEEADSLQIQLFKSYEETISTRSPASFGFVYKNVSNVDIPYMLGNFAYLDSTELVGITLSNRITTMQDYISALGSNSNDPNNLYKEQEADPLSYKSIPLFMRDIYPGEEIGFTLIFKNIPYIVFGIDINTLVFDDVGFMTLINTSAVTAMSSVANLTQDFYNDYSQSRDLFSDLSQYMTDSSEYVHLVYQGFIESGILSAIDTTGFEYSCNICPSLYGGDGGLSQDLTGRSGADLLRGPIGINIGQIETDKFDIGGPIPLQGPPGRPLFPNNGPYASDWCLTCPPAGCDTWTQAGQNVWCNFQSTLTDPKGLLHIPINDHFWVPIVPCPAFQLCVLTGLSLVGAAPAIGVVAVISEAGGAFAAKALGYYFTTCMSWTSSCMIRWFSKVTTGKEPRVTSFEDYICAKVVEPCDPNEIQGPTGYGDEQFISINDTVNYTVLFENSDSFATAPAQGVRIEVPLSEYANPLSVRLGSFGFANQIFEVPGNVASYQDRLDLRDSLGIYVDVIAGLDITNNQVFWQFESVDPVTGLLPSDPFTGLLPINDSTGVGEGFVKFNVRPVATSHTGDTMGHAADIFFDLNPPIKTNYHFNTIDALPPTGAIASLPAISADSLLTISYTVMDDSGGSGVDRSQIFLEKNGSNAVLVAQSSDTSITYETTPCDSLRFKAIGVDNVGNRRSLSDTGSWTETVVARTDLSLGPDRLICPNAMDTITAPQGQSYLWSTGDTSRQIIVQPALTTRYYVTITDNQGCPGVASVLVELDTCSFVSLQLYPALDLKVQPNPVSDEAVTVTINGADVGEYDLILRDQTGRAIIEKRIRVDGLQYTRDIPLEGVSAGVYFIELRKEAVLGVRKLVIQR